MIISYNLVLPVCKSLFPIFDLIWIQSDMSSMCLLCLLKFFLSVLHEVYLRNVSSINVYALVSHEVYESHIKVPWTCISYYDNNLFKSIVFVTEESSFHKILIGTRLSLRLLTVRNKKLRNFFQKDVYKRQVYTLHKTRIGSEKLL